MENKIVEKEEKNLSYNDFTSKIKKLFNEKTPKEFIKKRKGAENKIFDYVEVGYVIKKLNTISPFWNFEVVDEKREGNEIYVKGRLTFFFSPEFSISKEQYGASKVKISNGRPISLGDDYKAAASDALKKCASMFGIAHDVYFQENIQEEENEENNGFWEENVPQENATEKQIYALKKYQEIGKVDKGINVESLTKNQASKILSNLLKK